MISTKINNEEDTQEYLYHYTTIETLVLYILPQKTLRFSNIRETNDPEEIYDHGFQMNDDLGGGMEPQDAFFAQFVTNQKRFADALRKAVKVLCCSQDSIPKQMDFPRNKGRGFIKPRMWAQYSDNHKGVCLVLDKKKFVEKFDDEFCDRYHLSRDVIYEYDYDKLEASVEAYTLYTSELKENSIEKVVENRIEKFADIYYFSKHPDWRDENEYRFLIKDTSEENPGIGLDGILKGIIVGTRADKLLYEPIRIMSQQFSVVPELYELVYINSDYFLFPMQKDNKIESGIPFSHL